MGKPDEGMGVKAASVESEGVEGEGVVDDRMAVSDGEGLVSYGADYAPAPRRSSSPRTYTKIDPKCPCRDPNQQCMFQLPFIHSLLFVSLECSTGVPVTYSGSIPVMFW